MIRLSILHNHPLMLHIRNGRGVLASTYLPRGWSIKFATGLNIKISIVQKVYEWLSCHFPKMITPWGDHFGKISGWSQIYFLIYDFFSIYPSRKFYAPPSRYTPALTITCKVRPIEWVLKMNWVVFSKHAAGRLPSAMVLTLLLRVARYCCCWDWTLLDF